MIPIANKRRTHMAFQVSPGVLVKEKDLTNVIPAVATTIGVAGQFNQGPIDEVIY